MRIFMILLALVYAAGSVFSVYLTQNIVGPPGHEGAAYVMFWALAIMLGLLAACALLVAVAGKEKM